MTMFSAPPPEYCQCRWNEDVHWHNRGATEFCLHYQRNELLEAVIEIVFDGDRSGLITFMVWLERRAARTEEVVQHAGHWATLRRIRQTYSDWIDVQRIGGLP